jgi:hypothetical protein
MLRLSDNPMQACRIPMLAAEQCPKALAWMAALCLAGGDTIQATAWMTELIGQVVWVKTRASNGTARALRDTASMS